MKRQTEMVVRRRGGPRPGSGPQKRNRYDVSHHARPFLDDRTPVHVMLRVRKGVPGLRQRHLYHAIRAALRKAGDRTDFRVVHISIQTNHLHLIAEAESARSLSKGVQGLAISAAKRINAKLGRRGSLFEFRYPRFDGWSEPIEIELPEGYVPLGVKAPTTWLLRVGWQKLGPLDPFATPGPAA